MSKDVTAPQPDTPVAAIGIDAVMPFVVAEAECPLEGGTEADFGTVKWRTLICADKTPSTDMVAGVAEFGPLDTLEPHRHAPAEMYYGLSGSGTVTIDGVPHLIMPGVAVFIPPHAEHGTVAGDNGLRFLYVFPESRFSDVEYRFTPR